MVTEQYARETLNPFYIYLGDLRKDLWESQLSLLAQHEAETMWHTKIGSNQQWPRWNLPYQAPT
jgi:hypothetical protein